jgi:hypothetical protein
MEIGSLSAQSCNLIACGRFALSEANGGRSEIKGSV